MSDWMIKYASLLTPLYLKLKQIQLAQPVIHVDEIRLKVVQQEKATCFMWGDCSGTDSPQENALPNMVLTPRLVLFYIASSKQLKLTGYRLSITS